MGGVAVDGDGYWDHVSEGPRPRFDHARTRVGKTLSGSKQRDEGTQARSWINGVVCGFLEYDDDGAPKQETIKPMVDGGTEGFKGHTRVILPGVTPCFHCTLWLFPPQVRPRALRHLSLSSLVARDYLPSTSTLHWLPCCCRRRSRCVRCRRRLAALRTASSGRT
jgi:hypothetical protein